MHEGCSAFCAAGHKKIPVFLIHMGDITCTHAGCVIYNNVDPPPGINCCLHHLLGGLPAGAVSEECDCLSAFCFDSICGSLRIALEAAELIPIFLRHIFLVIFLRTLSIELTIIGNNFSAKSRQTNCYSFSDSLS